MKILSEETYNSIKRELANGDSYQATALRLGVNNTLVSKVNKTLDYEHYLVKYCPKVWGKLQEKKRIGQYTVPEGDGEDTASVKRFDTYLKGQLKKSSQNKPSYSLTEEIYTEIKQCLMNKTLRPTELVSRYHLSPYVLGRIRESKTYAEWLTLPKSYSRQQKISKQVIIEPQNGNAKQIQKTRKDLEEKQSDFREQIRPEQSYTLNITITLKDIKRAKGGLLLDLKKTLLGE